MPELVTVLGWTGTVLIIAMTAPQAWRTGVQGHTAGVPIGRPWVLLQISLAWLGYGLYGGGAFQIITNGCTSLMAVAILIRLLPATAAGDRRTPLWAGLTAALSVAVIGLGETGGLGAVGLLAAAIAILICAPQLLSLVRNPHLDSSGVSRLSCWLQLVACAVWCSYGVLRGEPAVWLPNLIIFPTVGWLLLLLRQSASAPVSAVPAPGLAVPGLATPGFGSPVLTAVD